MRTQLVDGLFADLLQVVRFLRVYEVIVDEGEARINYHLIEIERE